MTYRTRNILVASGLALLAIVFMVVYVSKARNGSASDVGKGLVSVLFAAQDIHAGTPGATLQNGALVTKEVPQSAVAPDSIASPQSVAGQVATQDILAGEPVTTRKFGPIAAAGVRSRIEGMQRVVQVAGDENQVLDGTLQPGDRVDVIGSWNAPENCGSCHVTRVVAANVLVVATSAEVGASDQQGQAPVQLRLTNGQVNRVFWLSKNGDWWLALRPVVKPAERRHRDRELALAVAGGRLMSSVRIFLTGFRPSISALRDELAEQPGVFVTGAAGTMSESSRRLREENPDVVVHAVFGSAMLEEEIESIREVTQAPIVLLAEDEDPTLLDEALHTDVADVVLLPQTADRVAFTVRNAARRAAAHEAAGPKRAKVITVFSPKGGTGKTVVSTHLAAAVAKHQKARTLLADLDLQFGDAAIMLGLQPEQTLHELATGPGALDADKLRGYLTKHAASGLDLLARAAPAGGRRAGERRDHRAPARGGRAAVRRDRRGHLSLVPRPDAVGARTLGCPALRLHSRGTDAQERPSGDRDSAAALVPRGSDEARAQPVRRRRRVASAGRRGGAWHASLLRAAERP